MSYQCIKIKHINIKLLINMKQKRLELAKDMAYIDKVLIEGTEKARSVARENMKKFKKALRIDYFN